MAGPVMDVGPFWPTWQNVPAHICVFQLCLNPAVSACTFSRTFIL